MNVYDEEYDRYEPELKVWPFILLGFLVPLVPFICNIMLANAGIIESARLIYGILNYIVIAIAFFAVAGVVRTAKGSWVLALDGFLYFILELIFWAYYKVNGFMSLNLPFVVAIIPSFILLLSYAFFAKRSKLPAWGTSTIVALVFSVVFVIYLYMKQGTDTAESIACLVFSFLLVLLSLFTFFVTKRSEVTPWYMNIILIGFVITAFFIEPGFGELVKEDISAGDVAIHILKTIATSYRLWLLISMCFIYAGLAMKSCFKTLKNDNSTDGQGSVQEVRQYTPPTNFQSSKSTEEERPHYNPPVDDRAYQNRREPVDYRQDRYSDRSDRYPNAPNRERYDSRYDSDYDRHYREYDDRYYDSPRDDRNRRDSYRYDDRPSRYDSDDYDRDYRDDRDSYRRQRREQDRPMLERDDRRSYNNDQYRSSYRDKDDKWFDLLRGGIDEDEYYHRQEDDIPPRRR